MPKKKPAAKTATAQETTPTTPSTSNAPLHSSSSRLAGETGPSSGQTTATRQTADSNDDATTPPVDTDAVQSSEGDDLLAATSVIAESQGNTLESSLIPPAHARPGEAKATCWERLRKDARAAGMPRGQGPGTAYQWATMQVDRLFPPPEPVEVVVEPGPVEYPVEFEPEPVESAPVVQQLDDSSTESPAPAPIPTDDSVPGLRTLPASWGVLPANTSLQVEISWVSANRLLVRDGSGVDLSRALSPAPSYSALSWLETSVLFPSKFADISVKATQQNQDEKEHIRRERLSIEEIRGLLAEMLKDAPVY